MEFKKVYTAEELQELSAWYEEHLDSLPASFEYDDAIQFTDLHETVKAFLSFMDKGKENSTFGGFFYMFFRLKEKLMEGEAEKT